MYGRERNALAVVVAVGSQQAIEQPTKELSGVVPDGNEVLLILALDTVSLEEPSESHRRSVHLVGTVVARGQRRLYAHSLERLDQEFAQTSAALGEA